MLCQYVTDVNYEEASVARVKYILWTAMVRTLRCERVCVLYRVVSSRAILQFLAWSYNHTRRSVAGAVLVVIMEGSLR